MMSGAVIGFVVEIIVAALLATTISYCIVLNRRLERLKADEHALKATISELITATEIAERAIQGLKLTVRECDASLGARLKSAERYVVDLDRQVAAGEGVLAKITQVTLAARKGAPATDMPAAQGLPAAETPEPRRASSTLAAAEAFLARNRANAA